MYRRWEQASWRRAASVSSATLLGVCALLAGKSVTGQPAVAAATEPLAPAPAPAPTLAGIGPGQPGGPTGQPTGSVTGASSAAAPGPGVRTVTGPVVQVGYGPVQVQVTVTGTRIVDVQALETPSADGHSRRIAAYAVPVLRQEVLAAQSARVDAVSGATYTSQGYLTSLQAALDAAGR